MCKSPDDSISTLSAFKCVTTSYQLFVGSVAILTTPVQVKALGNMIGKVTFTEGTAEPLPSWHIPLNDKKQRPVYQLQEFKSPSIWRRIPLLWNFKSGRKNQI